MLRTTRKLNLEERFKEIYLEARKCYTAARTRGAKAPADPGGTEPTPGTWGAEGRC